ncbi:MAG TPA: glucokinase [Candidatus Saccharimonadia bacterium]|nr:glucokinase [Candidatus Saccharimonadia bacterium]
MFQLLQGIQQLPQRNDVVAAYDVGGTNARGRLVDSDGCIVWEGTADTLGANSVGQFMGLSYLRAGFRPAQAVAALAGPPQADGSIQLTNRNWPRFSPQDIAESTNVPTATINDLAAMALGLTVAGHDGDFREVWTGSRHDQLRRPAGPTLVLNAGSGIGAALVNQPAACFGPWADAGEAESSPLPDITVLSSEAGHTTWQPRTKEEDRYLRYLRQTLKRRQGPITVEEALGGCCGFDHLFDFCTQQTRWLTTLGATRLRREVKKYQRQRRPLGPIITAGALEYRYPCLRAMNIWASVWAQYMRNLTVTTLPGMTVVLGGVLRAPNVADSVFRNPNFSPTYLGNGAAHSDLMAAQVVMLATSDEIGLRGAVVQARRLQAGTA